MNRQLTARLRLSMRPVVLRWRAGFDYRWVGVVLILPLVWMVSCRTEPSSLDRDLSANRGAGITHVDAEVAHALLAKQGRDVVILDIRTPEEYEAGHLAGATNIDFYSKSFSNDIAALDDATIYLVHCNSGRRSTTALELFRALDFRVVYHLDGGIKAWRSQGYEVTE